LIYSLSLHDALPIYSNFEGYLTASKYIVRKGISKSNLFEFEELINIDSLFEKILVWSKRPTTQEAFVKLVKSLKISSYDDNNVRSEEHTSELQSREK